MDHQRVSGCHLLHQSHRIRFRRRWEKTLAAAEDIPGETRDRLVFHSLRHCFASFLASAGKPLHIIADLMGHSMQTTTARYAHLLPDAKRAAVDAIEDALAFGNEGASETAQNAL